MNTDLGYFSSALLRPMLEAAGSSFFNSLSAEDTESLASTLKQLRDPNATVSATDADNLVSLLVRRSNNEALCVQAPQKFNVHSSCQLQHLFLCCNNLREALYYLEKFSTLLSDELEVQVTRTRDNVIKVKLPVSDNFILAAERHRSEIIISTLLNWLRQLCPSLELNLITLPFPATSYAQQYQSHWRSQIEFNSNEFTIQFHAKWLDEGLHKTNPHILSMMKKEVEEQYRKLARSGSLAERIRKVFVQRKVRLNANQQEVADYFHISARTLNRHLSSEGTSLKQLVTEVRLEIARDLLLHGTESIEQIALNIGLSGRRTLDRIFIKELNMSPAQYRSMQGATERLAVNQ
jgi:AraC-like DNA-binding protein